jgi:hypothetical protein
MERKTSSREVLVEACRSLIRDFNDFWVLSAITDYSFEGDRSSHFSKVVKSYVTAGAPASLVTQMQKGINGNLAEILAAKGAAKRNKWKGQDLLLTGADGTDARVEVKQVFDCTVPKYYQSVAADLKKLKDVSERGFIGGLFLAVFFVQFPNLRYARHLGPRKVFCEGILKQYQRVCKAIGVNANWPADHPEMVPLTLPRDQQIRAALEARFRSVHGTASDLSQSGLLESAAVGGSLWEFTAAQ